MSTAIRKNIYQMPKKDYLVDSMSQQITKVEQDGPAWFPVLDLQYAYRQLPSDKETAKHCNFSIVGGDIIETYRFLTGFYGLPDMLAELQRALYSTLIGRKNINFFR